MMMAPALSRSRFALPSPVLAFSAEILMMVSSSSSYSGAPRGIAGLEQIRHS
jgi:hypothetical protein